MVKKKEIPPWKVKLPKCEFCHSKMIYASKRKLGYGEYCIGVCTKCSSIAGQIRSGSGWSNRRYRHLSLEWKISFKEIRDRYQEKMYQTKW